MPQQRRRGTAAAGGRRESGPGHGISGSDPGDLEQESDAQGPGSARNTDSQAESVECLRCRGCRQCFPDPTALRRHCNSRWMRGTACAIQASKKARPLVSTWKPGHSHQAAGVVDEQDDSEQERNFGYMDMFMDAGDNADEPVDAPAPSPVRVSTTDCTAGSPGRRVCSATVTHVSQ
jgi:hypothetical protein